MVIVTLCNDCSMLPVRISRPCGDASKVITSHGLVNWYNILRHTLTDDVNDASETRDGSTARPSDV